MSTPFSMQRVANKWRKGHSVFPLKSFNRTRRGSTHSHKGFRKAAARPRERKQTQKPAKIRLHFLHDPVLSAQVARNFAAPFLAMKCAAH
jgi:hypothetical protein